LHFSKTTGVRLDGLMKRHTSIYAVCFHKHYRHS
jgi:hypothetical protein